MRRKGKLKNRNNHRIRFDTSDRCVKYISIKNFCYDEKFYEEHCQSHVSELYSQFGAVYKLLRREKLIQKKSGFHLTAHRHFLGSL